MKYISIDLIDTSSIFPILVVMNNIFENLGDICVWIFLVSNSQSDYMIVNDKDKVVKVM